MIFQSMKHAAIKPDMTSTARCHLIPMLQMSNSTRESKSGKHRVKASSWGKNRREKRQLSDI